MELKLDYTPFKTFWINCAYNTLFSLLTSFESSYKYAALLNDYSYLINEMQTPNETKYISLAVKPIAKYYDLYHNMLYSEQKPFNFNHGDNYFDILKELIQENKIILIGVDLFYWVPNSVCWNKHHWDHYSFINGFNDEKRVLYVFDDNFNGFDEFEVPEERLIKAIKHYPKKPSGYICKISKNIERFELSIHEVKDNARRLIYEISKKLTVTFWDLHEKDFIEGHMCDLICTQIFQIVNRHIANQMLIQEFDDRISNPAYGNLLLKYCKELQDGWTIVKNKLVKIYLSEYKKSLISDLNEKCRYLLLKEIDMWNMFLKYVN